MDIQKNMLLQSIVKELENNLSRGKVLDLGCASGYYSRELHRLGYDATATDVTEQFLFKDQIRFIRFDANKPLPFPDGEFDFVLLAEVIEHLKDPYSAVKEIKRILKPGGWLILSTPNVLNLSSRMRFLVEGSYEYFREPPLDHIAHCRRTGVDESQIHVVAYRYHELEYLLVDCGFKIEKIFTSSYVGKGLSFLVPLIRFQFNSKSKRSKKKDGVDFERINNILLSKELLFGRHLIVKACKV